MDSWNPEHYVTKDHEQIPLEMCVVGSKVAKSITVVDEAIVKMMNTAYTSQNIR